MYTSVRLVLFLNFCCSVQLSMLCSSLSSVPPKCCCFQVFSLFSPMVIPHDRLSGSLLNIVPASLVLSFLGAWAAFFLLLCNSVKKLWDEKFLNLKKSTLKYIFLGTLEYNFLGTLSCSFVIWTKNLGKFTMVLS